MRWLQIVSLLSCLFLVSTAAGQTPDDGEALPQHRYALLIGVDRYDDQTIGILTDPVNDVVQLREALHDNAQFDYQNITVLVNDGDPNHQPTRTNILKALYKIRGSVPSDGDALLLVMFSGHGMMEGGEGFVLPKDAATSSEPGLLADTSLPVKMLMRSMAETKAKQTILIMDACRNPVSSTAKASNEGQALTNEFKSEFDFRTYNSNISASLVLFATGIGDKALVHGETKLGYFSEVLIEGIRGKGAGKCQADTNGNVTLERLLECLQTEVPRRVSENEQKFIQKPDFILTGYLPQKLVIAHPGSTNGSAPPPRPTQVSFSFTPEKLADSVHWYTQKHFNPDVDDPKNMTLNSLWLDLPPDTLAQVKSATYILHHPSFRHPMFSVPDNSKHLAVRFQAYGCVDFATVVAELSSGTTMSADFNQCSKHQEDRLAPE